MESVQNSLARCCAQMGLGVVVLYGMFRLTWVSLVTWQWEIPYLSNVIMSRMENESCVSSCQQNTFLWCWISTSKLHCSLQNFVATNEVNMNIIWSRKLNHIIEYLMQITQMLNNNKSIKEQRSGHTVHYLKLVQSTWFHYDVILVHVY